MIAIADAVQAHVNECFTTYASVVAAIEAGAVCTKEQIDAAFAQAVNGRPDLSPTSRQSSIDAGAATHAVHRALRSGSCFAALEG
jgi:hypothetical protein